MHAALAPSAVWVQQDNDMPLSPREATSEAEAELPVRAGYAAWAPWYDDDGNPLTALEGPAVWKWFGPVAGRRAVDIGCGTGRHTLALVEAGARVTALDPTSEMMARGRERLRGHAVDWVLHALPDALPFRAGTFDLAMLGLVLEHVDELEPALAQVARVLAPGGRCIASGLHPDRTAEGQRARFIDPVTGVRHPIKTLHRTIVEYLGAAALAGFVLAGHETLEVPAELGERLPRARRYVGMNLGWVACWTKPA